MPKLTITDLPDSLIELIKEFIPNKTLVFVNSTYYNLYHHLIKDSIPMYESYIRDMIRRDNEFVFNKIVSENIESWLKNRQYRYKNMIFTNYIYFVLFYCIENNSDRCREIIITNLTKRDLSRNLHKKNVIKYIKWSN